MRNQLKNLEENKEHVLNLKSIWSALEDVYDILGGYGFPTMDKAATEMKLKPDWSTSRSRELPFGMRQDCW